MIPCSRLKRSDLYTLSESKLLENHTLHSGTYLYSPYMSVPPPPGYRLRSLFYTLLNELPFWDFRLLLEKPPAALIEIAHDNYICNQQHIILAELPSMSYIHQGHPTAIFGKHLFRNICCKISCLPASRRIFEHLKKWYNCPLFNGFLP